MKLGLWITSVIYHAFKANKIKNKKSFGNVLCGSWLFILFTFLQCLYQMQFIFLSSTFFWKILILEDKIRIWILPVQSAGNWKTMPVSYWRLLFFRSYFLKGNALPVWTLASWHHKNSIPLRAIVQIQINLFFQAKGL